MGFIKRLFGQNDDPLNERADALVAMARIAAIDASSLLKEFPISQYSDIQHFDFVVAIAGVFIAVTRLRELHLEDARERRLMGRITRHLVEWSPDKGMFGFKHCKAFFDRNVEGLAKIGHDERFVTSDAIGMWVVWEVFDHFPETEAERRLVRTIGVMVTHGFFDWWSNLSAAVADS